MRPHSFPIKAEIKQALERFAREDKRSPSPFIELALEVHVATAAKTQWRKPRS
jgi:hypothetical protein